MTATTAVNENRLTKRLVGNGSDGTRTRGLRRDRPHRRKRRLTTIDSNRLQTPQIRASISKSTSAPRTAVFGTFGPLLGQTGRAPIGCGRWTTTIESSSTSSLPSKVR
jgi:hypothetical protein